MIQNQTVNSLELIETLRSETFLRSVKGMEGRRGSEKRVV